MAHLVVAFWNPWKQNKNMGHKIYYGTISHCPFWKYSHNRYVKSRTDSDGWASDSSNTAWPSVWCCQAGNGRNPLYKYICYLEVRRTAFVFMWAELLIITKRHLYHVICNFSTIFGFIHPILQDIFTLLSHVKHVISENLSKCGKDEL